MQELQSTPHLDHLEQLRTSAYLTQGEYLELEDHYYSTYENFLENGDSESVASQKTALSVGTPEKIIQVYQRNHWKKLLLDRYSFFVFGLVFNFFWLWVLGMAINIFVGMQLHSFFPHPAIIYLRWSVLILLLIGLLVLYSFLYHTVLKGKTACIPWTVRLKKTSIFVLVGLLSLLLVYLLYLLMITPFYELKLTDPHGFIITTWFHFFWILNLLLSLGYLLKNKKDRSNHHWNIRLFLFHLAGVFPFALVNLVNWLFIEYSIDSGLLLLTLTIFSVGISPYLFHLIWRKQRFLSS